MSQKKHTRFVFKLCNPSADFEEKTLVFVVSKLCKPWADFGENQCVWIICKPQWNNGDIIEVDLCCPQWMRKLREKIWLKYDLDTLGITGAVTFLDTPCPSGHYCPAGTQLATQYPCPAGTFNNVTLARDVADCVPCPGGHYCDVDGLVTPSGLCAAGETGSVYNPAMMLSCHQ